MFILIYVVFLVFSSLNYCSAAVVLIATNKVEYKQTDKQTNRQTDRHYENNGHLAVNQQTKNSTFLAAPVAGEIRAPPNMAL